MIPAVESPVFRWPQHPARTPLFSTDRFQMPEVRREPALGAGLGAGLGVGIQESGPLASSGWALPRGFPSLLRCARGCQPCAGPSRSSRPQGTDWVATPLRPSGLAGKGRRLKGRRGGSEQRSGPDGPEGGVACPVDADPHLQCKCLRWGVLNPQNAPKSRPFQSGWRPRLLRGAKPAGAGDAVFPGKADLSLGLNRRRAQRGRGARRRGGACVYRIFLSEDKSVHQKLGGRGGHGNSISTAGHGQKAPEAGLAGASPHHPRFPKRGRSRRGPPELSELRPLSCGAKTT